MCGYDASAHLMDYGIQCTNNIPKHWGTRNPSIGIFAVLWQSENEAAVCQVCRYMSVCLLLHTVSFRHFPLGHTMAGLSTFTLSSSHLDTLLIVLLYGKR